MGNAQGMRRIWRNQQHHHDNHHPHHHHHHHHQDQSLEVRPGQASPTEYSSQYYASPQAYPDGYIRNNGQFIVNIQPSALTYVMNTAPPVSIPVLENLKANTIKNDVNLRKSTLRLEKDEENPGFYLVAFSFDALAAGWYVTLIVPALILHTK
jgi:G3E family GTPase